MRFRNSNRNRTSCVDSEVLGYGGFRENDERGQRVDRLLLIYGAKGFACMVTLSIFTGFSGR